ncbi:MAG TPA: hypothetical protein VFU29_20150 [Chitinophagaceae bacterium]|nr:hypothetical protein [Chitinophagaceae bacterium]
MKKSMLLFFLFFVLVSSHSIAQEKPLSKKALQQLDEAQKEMVNAISNGDSAAFKKIAGFDYIDINANGTKVTLQSMLIDIPNFKGIIVSFSEQSQRVYGNFVLKNGRAKFSLRDQLVAEVFYTQGWVYRDKKWQFVHWQGTMTKDFLQMK